MRPLFVSISIIFILLSFWTKAQVPFFKEVWLNESATPVAVHGLATCGNGYLWLATDNGVFRYNGRVFTSVRDSVKHAAKCITQYGNALYVGYSDGLIGCIMNDELTFLPLKFERPKAAITSLHTLFADAWLITTEDGLFFSFNNYCIALNKNDKLGDNFIYDAMLSDERLVTITDRGINIIDPSKENKTINLTTLNGLPDNIVSAIEAYSSHDFWIGTQQGGIVLCNIVSGKITPLKFSVPWQWGQVNDIWQETSGHIWIATEQGDLLSAILEQDSLHIIPYHYPGRKINKIVIDKSGNMWCATNKGLLMNSVLYAENIKIPASYNLSQLTALSCDQSGTIWYALGKDVFRFMPGSQKLPEKVLSVKTSVSSLYTDKHREAIWIGTLGEGLFCYTQHTLRSITSIPSLVNGSILSITEAQQHLWLASLNGVEETLDSNGSLILLKHYNKASGIGSDYVYQLYTDHLERVWMATDGGGVTMYDGQKMHRWSMSDGLQSQVVYTIAEDVFGNIWAGTLEKGLYEFDGTTWKQISDVRGLQDMNISSLQANKTGQVIVVNQKGIDQWYPSSGQFRHFNRRLGIDIDSTSAVLNCITGDTAGNIYVPYEHGMIAFKSLDNDYDIRPNVHITTVSLFLNPVSEGRQSFQYDENHISFHYDGINFANPERVRYRYKLEGFDENWIRTSDETASFIQLPPGHYTFKVQASLNNYFDGAYTDTFSFIIRKPFWLRPWFLLLAIIMVFGLVYLYIRLREQNIRNRSRLQKERMLFEYEHLKSQVNPHFLFNSLNTLVSLIEDDQQMASRYTVHLSDLYRNMLSYKDRDLILLSEEFDLIQDYMFIQKSRFGDALVLGADVPDHIMKTRRIVPLALQIIVENAIKHNVVSLSHPLIIHLFVEDDLLVVSNQLQPKLSKEKGAGLGLINIQKRYQLLSGRAIVYGLEENKYIVKLPLL